MDLHLPNRDFLQRTGDVDYAHWNYQFPIKYIQRYRFNSILKLMGKNIYDKLLEVGTGGGIFLPELARHCHELYACDIHNKMSYVKNICQLTSIKAELSRCPVEETVYPDNFFDVIVAVSVLEFVEDLEKSINELKRILKPNGMFLTICPQQSVLLDFVLNFYSRTNPDEEFGTSRTKVFKALEANFNVIEKRLFPSVIGRMVPVYYSYKLTL
jgi:ubiquinone/menaquinone biosynthesis C-methylase UbiE